MKAAPCSRRREKAAALCGVGLHRRIGPHHVSGMKFLKSGVVRHVGMVRLFAYGDGGEEACAE
jgi:hypothetical protein